MAVYTPVSEAQVGALLQRLRLGELQQLSGIAAGIENSNFFIDCDAGRYVLTLFERLSAQQLPFYLGLMQHLAAKGLPVPAPQADPEGQILFELGGKPAAVVTCLRGSHQLSPNVFHCEQLGHTLARLHEAVADFRPFQPNLRGLPWWQAVAPTLYAKLDADTAALLREELAFQTELAASRAYQDLPRGAIHADLFRDNAMFEGLPGREQLCGVFDLYFAGVDTFLFDLAVCLNDWCIDLASGRLIEERAAALVAAYEAVRPLSAAEHRLLPAALRAAALRFWLSRLDDWHRPRAAQLLKPHDPTHFERVLRERIAAPWHAMKELG
ncbi:homoserine kinase type II [Inhella inkyongensis]|uniref:Homoserine kinase n=1 Tax=Inhella inkyongensis TaxID=392593 RepID=A0A840S3C7_9BURK|nr:homoserine kinase [Inhella inkyongensis]MBB5204233.1 homoserine kinase type II [Inhella inkyongensis]